MRTYHVYRHLLPTTDAQGRTMGGSRYPSLVRSHNGTPYTFGDLRTAVAVAERLQRDNARAGRDHCANVRFTVGWRGADA
jgi:hypothetical protein